MKIKLSKIKLTAISIIILFMAASFYGMQSETKSDVSVNQGSDLQASELASLMGLYVWKLDVDLPDDAKEVNVRLEVQKKGESKKNRLGSSIIGFVTPDVEREILIAIIPLEGDLINTDKVRVVIDAFGMKSSSIANNPLKYMGIGDKKNPQKASDGTFALIGGYNGDTISSPISETADALISLKIEPK